MTAVFGEDCLQAGGCVSKDFSCSPSHCGYICRLYSEGRLQVNDVLSCSDGALEFPLFLNGSCTNTSGNCSCKDAFSGGRIELHPYGMVDRGAVEGDETTFFPLDCAIFLF